MRRPGGEDVQGIGDGVEGGQDDALALAARDAGRVMLALDGPGPHTAAVAAAFRAAHRRGTDLTVVHGARPDQVQDHGGQTFRSLRRWHVRFPDVAVREGLMAAPFGAALGLAATGVALLVLTTPTSTEGRARTWSRSLDHTVTDLLGLRTPAALLFVQAPPATVADLLTAPRPDSTISEPGARPASGPRP
jgi:hypothetical protein